MATTSRRAYAIPKSAAPRALWQATADPYPIGDAQTQFCLSLCGVSGSWCTQGLFEPSKHLWQVWDLIPNIILPLLPSCWGFSFALGCGVSPQIHSSATQPPLLGRKVTTNLESILKSRNITLPTKVSLVKAMVFLVVMCQCESWTRLSDFTSTFQFHALEKEMATHASVLAWRIPGTGESGGLPSMGLHRVSMTEAT